MKVEDVCEQWPVHVCMASIFSDINLFNMEFYMIRVRNLPLEALANWLSDMRVVLQCIHCHWPD